MPGSPNASFIPKHTTNKIEKKNTPRRVFVGTIIVRVLFFAVMIVAVGVYAFDSRLNGQIKEESNALYNAASTFKKDDLDRVIAFDNRLQQANILLSNTVSIGSVLKILEENILQTVQIENLALTRTGLDKYELVAEMRTDSFESVIYQRTRLSGTGAAARPYTLSALENVLVQLPGQTRQESQVSSRRTFTFTAKLDIPSSAITFVPVANQMPQAGAVLGGQSEPVLVNQEALWWSIHF